MARLKDKKDEIKDIPDSEVLDDDIDTETTKRYSN